MSKAVECDQCGQSVRTETDEDDDLFWITVGWRSGLLMDACSVDCARKLVSFLRRQQIEAVETTA